jgi:hypothetical protein
MPLMGKVYSFYYQSLGILERQPGGGEAKVGVVRLDGWPRLDAPHISKSILLKCYCQNRYF